MRLLGAGGLLWEILTLFRRHGQTPDIKQLINDPQCTYSVTKMSQGDLSKICDLIKEARNLAPKDDLRGALKLFKRQMMHVPTAKMFPFMKICVSKQFIESQDFCFGVAIFQSGRENDVRKAFYKYWIHWLEWGEDGELQQSMGSEGEMVNLDRLKRMQERTCQDAEESVIIYMKDFIGAAGDDADLLRKFLLEHVDQVNYDFENNMLLPGSDDDDMFDGEIDLKTFVEMEVAQGWVHSDNEDYDSWINDALIQDPGH